MHCCLLSSSSFIFYLYSSSPFIVAMKCSVLVQQFSDSQSWQGCCWYVHIWNCILQVSFLTLCPSSSSLSFPQNEGKGEIQTHDLHFIKRGQYLIVLFLGLNNVHSSFVGFPFFFSTLLLGFIFCQISLILH